MKKIMIVSAALLALAMIASCQKENIGGNVPDTTGITRVTATILQTRTAVASDGKVSWSKGDEIVVTDASSVSAVFVAESAGVSTAFDIKDGETPLGAGPYTAAYGDIDNQVYDACGANCPLAAAASGTTDFTFSSPYAVLKITAKSENGELINKVEVLNGDTVVSALNCGDGVALSSDGSDFYVAVPPITGAALSVTFYTTDFRKATKTRLSPVSLLAKDLLPMTLTFVSDDWESACIAAGTKITMEDGSRKAVEELEVGDVIRTVDHKTGEVSAAPVCFIWKSPRVAGAFTLTFAGGVEVTVIEEHGFYDQEERKYAFINARNADGYIGHHFYDADGGRWLELTGCKRHDGLVDAYAIATSRHLNHLSNGILSMSDGSFKILANLFEFDEKIRYDADKKEADIATYGLTPLERILELEGFTETDYYDYNLEYVDIAVGKGLITWEWMEALSEYCVANAL